MTGSRSIRAWLTAEGWIAVREELSGGYHGKFIHKKNVIYLSLSGLDVAWQPIGLEELSGGYHGEFIHMYIKYTYGVYDEENVIHHSFSGMDIAWQPIGLLFWRNSQLGSIVTTSS
ncbi:hypothetical protein DPMN_032711 [Dreissena polymorpha]|uniref:Uncharacterized protein n=1 Tax=Dreissena polymorpha TaxID=45954 RepID=A0A9D4M2A4_DREPO|nr:hypothetical protein DPMN_032711 [Dreissena polymorpha]